MTKHNIFIIILFASFSFFTSCEADIDEHVPDAGEADLTTYVALGNSLTAGYMDGELYREGQLNSLAAIMAGQFTHLGLETFNQPLMHDDVGFGGRLVLAEVDGNLLPVEKGTAVDPINYQNIFQDKGPFHNLGVPGAKTQHLLFPGYAMANPYYKRFAADTLESTVLGDALALDPSFFSLWIGNNDILDYALNGGIDMEADPPQEIEILPPQEFEAAYAGIIQQLTQNGAEGVTANIVEITQIPFFNTVPYNALFLDDPELVNGLNAAYAAAEHIEFTIGLNPLVVADPDHPAGIRQLEEGELVLLRALQGIQNDGLGSLEPIPPDLYLSLEQVSHIEQHVSAYNDIIEGVASGHDLALVDVKQLLRDAESGIYFDAIPFSLDFVTGGVFSLDGVHLSARGYAIVANAFIASINRQYDASIPKVAIGNYPGIVFP